MTVSEVYDFPPKALDGRAPSHGVTAFAGIVAFDGRIDDQTQDRLARALQARKGRVVIQRARGAVLAQRYSDSLRAAGASTVRPPDATFGSAALFAALARLDNREELADRLGLTGPELAGMPDELLVRRTVERAGEAGIARLLGAFAFAQWDPVARHLLLGRDCLGNRALFFHRGPRFTAFATSVNTLLALPHVPREIDEIALAHFLALNLSEERRTFYRGIERVPSRSVVAIDRDGIAHRRYWAPDLDGAPPYRREEDYVERARELLDQAVAAAIRDTPRVAISTSGGFDSSAAAATAARLGSAKSITCFTLVPPADARIDVGPFRYLDERDKVRALGRMHPALDLRFIPPEHAHPFITDDARLFAFAGLPVLNPTAMGWFGHLHEAAAKSGHRALLVGDRGNFGLTWSGVFSLIELLRTGEWTRFMPALRATARDSGRTVARSFVGDVLIPAAPAWLRRLVNRLRGRDPDSVARYSALNPAFIAEHGLARIWQRQDFDPWFGRHSRDAARHRAHMLFDQNQVGRDAVARWDDYVGIETRDPHADRRLLEFVLRVPEPLFAHKGVPRSFARAVLADRLPREILDERLKGAQDPAWFRALDARRQHIAADVERLEASPLARRLLDVPRLKRLVAQWPKDEHAAQQRVKDYRLALGRGVHVGRFVRWVEGGNA
jgi:asparagine synthase (glutamine-hydrolysing)